VTLTVLVIGGYGTFGGRLCRLLADEPRVRLLVAGRSIEKARAFCRRKSQAELVPAAFDRNGDVRARTAALAPDVVVDASGPFQAYGDDRYRVAEAAIAAGADYLDLADGRDFVMGIGSLDAAACAAGRFVLSGTSTCPVLTIAAARSLAEGLDRVDAVAAGIAPSPHAGVGLNVMRAIASYAGKPVRLTRDGKATVATGIVDSRVHTITVPGSVPLNRIRFSLVDVPDLDLLPATFPGLRSAWVGAGPTPALLHRALSTLARLVSWRVLPTLTFMAPVMDWGMDHVSWGEHRGGMFVEVRGLWNGEAVTNRWHMIAEGDRGPFVPSLVADIILRACLDGRRPAPGARPCHDDVTLGDYQPGFARLGIVTASLRGDPSTSLPLHRRLLGAAYERLSAPLREGHEVNSRLVLAGIADVERGESFLARAIAGLMRMPRSGKGLSVQVTMTRRGETEVWERRFGARSFRSALSLGRGCDEGLMLERFGALTFAMAEVVVDGELHLIQRRWRFLGIPMPRFLMPNGVAREHAAGGRFNFDVEIRLPFIGRIVTYQGWLAPLEA
jgi:hypothetical protein